jgi:hypothetical protein
MCPLSKESKQYMKTNYKEMATKYMIQEKKTIAFCFIYFELFDEKSDGINTYILFMVSDRYTQHF